MHFVKLFRFLMYCISSPLNQIDLQMGVDLKVGNEEQKSITFLGYVFTILNMFMISFMNIH